MGVCGAGCWSVGMEGAYGEGEATPPTDDDDGGVSPEVRVFLIPSLVDKIAKEMIINTHNEKNRLIMNTFGWQCGQ